MLTVSFLISAIMIIILSIFMITRRQPVTAAMTLVIIMMILAGMYGLLGAHFSAVAQIIVYAGAIMVVFVFVIMLLNLPPGKLSYGRVNIFEICLMGLGLLTAIFFASKAGHGYLAKLFISSDFSQLPSAQQYFEHSENVKNVSALMFTDYLWPFELISFLILVAIVGAIVVAKKDEGQA